MPVGVCKDRLADALARFGRVPIVKRAVVVRSDELADHPGRDAPYWSAGGLVHDRAGRVLLVQHTASSRWGTAWATPGGFLEDGETTVDGFLREVREEVGLGIDAPRLMRIFNETLTDGAEVRHGYFAQFVGRAATLEVRCGPGIHEARWFDQLPEDMAFRPDYVDDFERIRQARF